MSNIDQKTPYQNFLYQNFTTAFLENSDDSPIKPLYADITNRDEILYMQFEMEKKGKNFGIIENRLLKIENGRLFQVGKSQEEKEIPIPTSITIVRRDASFEVWEEKTDPFQGKIIMKFAQRTDITVYFREIIECMEIGVFLLSEIRKREGKTFNMPAKIHKEELINTVVSKIHQSKHQNSNLSGLKIKSRIGQILKTSLSDRYAIAQMFEHWKSQALFKKKSDSLSLEVLEISSKHDKLEGMLKIWARGTVSKQIALTSRAMNRREEISSFIFEPVTPIKDSWTDINSDEQIQIELQMINGLWKSERFTACDLRRVHRQYKFIELNLSGKGQMIYMKLKIDFPAYQTVRLPEKITPRHYRIIDEFYCKNDKTSLDLTTIHQYYLKVLTENRLNQYHYICFNRLKQLFELLKIQDLISKFFVVYPFKDYIDVAHQGTFLYEYFIKHEENQFYYDVQKIMWKFKENKYKSILVALKVFDQNPKFNFTEPFFHLVKRMYEIAERQTINRWKTQLFAKTQRGIESIAFFLSLAIIKNFPDIFIYQQFVNKKALPYNSLLFILILQNQLPAIYNKIVKLELNIEAYFGTHFVNIFSSLFSGDAFTRLLILLLEQKKTEVISNYYFTLIGAFLAIIELISRYECSYGSAQHFILTFEQMCRTLPDKYMFFYLTNKWKDFAKNYSFNPVFSDLVVDITDFYLTNAYSGDLGDISLQIYQQFTCYHYKNEADLRKIYFLIDKIDIGIEQQCSASLTLSIFQNGVKLYDHQFNGVDLLHLDHFIEMKLVKLDELTIICNTHKKSFSCRFDPKEVPSNLYFHCVKPLNLTHHLTPQSNRHIFIQTYIKDNCEIDSLENVIPNKYREVVLERNLSKQDIIFLKKFNKSFRMRQNNFNLLYLKLGWYGNHYLIPDERLLNLQILHQRRSGQSQLYSRIAAINKYSRTIYGKAMAPYPHNQQRQLSVQVIKEKIHTTYFPNKYTPHQQNQLNTYNSASRLLCYELDNFYIPSEIQFLQFYYEMNKKLPLIQYLSYIPNNFYSLPAFSLQVATYSSTCLLIISEKGIPFISSFSPKQIIEIEEQASEFNRLPQELQFSYSNKRMYFDEFLFYLRLNILKRVITLGRKDRKAGKEKKWPNSLVSISNSIPNYELHYFYEVMNETKQIIQLEFKQMSKLAPHVEYNDFGLVGGRWTSVYCIARLKSALNCLYYVLVAEKRKKYLLRDCDFISTNSDPGSIKTVDLSDEIANQMEIITYQLTQMFDF